MYNICSIYRQENVEINNLMGYLEVLFLFLKTLHVETLLFADFKIDTLKHYLNKKKYVARLEASDTEIQKNYQQEPRLLLRLALITR